MKLKKEFTTYHLDSLKVKDKDIKFHDIRSGLFAVHGLYKPNEGAGYRRLPDEVAKSVSEKVYNLYRNTAGGRIRFATDSNRIAVRIKVPHITMRPHMTLAVTLGCDIYAEAGGEERYCGTILPAVDMEDEYEGMLWVGDGMKEITINLPLYNDVDEIYVGIAQGAVVKPHRPYRISKPILFYGSSITQGAAASRPGTCYEAWISRKLDCDYINLGFAGAAKGEDAIADYMATLDISAFVCDYDHNASTAKHLSETLPKLYKKIRSANPYIPYIFISKPDIYFDYEENTNSRRVVIDCYSQALKSGDKNVWLIDGYSLFGSDGRNDCTVDRVHPNDLGFYRMAEIIGKTITIAFDKQNSPSGK